MSEYVIVSEKGSFWNGLRWGSLDNAMIFSKTKAEEDRRYLRHYGYETEIKMFHNCKIIDSGNEVIER